MRIGIDARILSFPKCGIGTYVSKLLEQFVRFATQDEFYLFSNQPLNTEYESILNNSQVKLLVFGDSKKYKRKWSQSLLPQQLRRNAIDIYHATWNNAVPVRTGCPVVLTIHDLIPLIIKGHFRNWRKNLRFLLQHVICAHRAKLILTNSKQSKEDIVRICGVKRDKVKVIYLGWDTLFQTQEPDAHTQAILSKYSLGPGRYFIDPAGIDHLRRNPLIVVESFANFLKESNNDRLKLVLTGIFYPQSRQFQRLQGTIDNLGLANRVILTGWIPTSEYKILLCNARCAVIPSLYEGFGLPVLEAFACKVPVISSTGGSLPEVVDDAGLLFDPYDKGKLTEYMRKIIYDASSTQQLIKKGELRLAQFSWEKTAKETYCVYQQFHNRHGCKIPKRCHSRPRFGEGKL